MCDPKRRDEDILHEKSNLLVALEWKKNDRRRRARDEENIKILLPLAAHRIIFDSREKEDELYRRNLKKEPKVDFGLSARVKHTSGSVKILQLSLNLYNSLKYFQRNGIFKCF